MLRGKQKTSRKEIKETYSRILSCGYCAASHVLAVCRFPAVGYTCGAYGWNYDVIELNSYTCLLTGYRRMFGKDIPDLSKWDHRARKIRDGWNDKTYKAKASRFRRNFLKYIDSLFAGKEKNDK